MSRRPEGMLFIGRLSKSTRQRDVEDVFERYGPLARCEIKYGAEMAYGFVDYEDRRDAEDALRRENGRHLLGSSIIVEWARGNPRRPQNEDGGRRRNTYDECYKCHRTGHWARDCLEDRYGYRSSRRSYRRSRSYSRDRSRSRDRRTKYRSRSRSNSYDNSKRHRRSRSRSYSRSRSLSPSKDGHSRSRSLSPRHSRSRSGSRD